jgi:hypothetical protein
MIPPLLTEPPAGTEDSAEVEVEDTLHTESTTIADQSAAAGPVRREVAVVGDPGGEAGQRVGDDVADIARAVRVCVHARKRRAEHTEIKNMIWQRCHVFNAIAVVNVVR